MGIENKVWQTSQNWTIDDRIWCIITEEDPKLLCCILMAFWIIWLNRNQIAHVKDAQSIDACCTRIHSYIAHWERKILFGLNKPIADSSSTHSFTFFSDGSWSRLTSIGGWASVAIFGDIILRCKADFQIGSISGLEEEIKGMVEALLLEKGMDCI